MKEYKLKTYAGNHPRIPVTEEFVTANKLTFNRTQEEIVDKIKNSDDKFFGFDREVLIGFLDFEHAKEFYKDEYVKEVEAGTKTDEGPVTDIYEATQDMLDYLIFGYMKALDERGISASRSVCKLGAWMWILGREDLEKIVTDDGLFNPYGMPNLIALTEGLGLPVPDDVREFAEKKQ